MATHSVTIALPSPDLAAMLQHESSRLRAASVHFLKKSKSYHVMHDPGLSRPRSSTTATPKRASRQLDAHSSTSRIMSSMPPPPLPPIFRKRPASESTASVAQRRLTASSCSLCGACRAPSETAHSTASMPRACGHRFCESCSMTWLPDAQTCPVRFCENAITDGERTLYRMKQSRRAADCALASLPTTINPLINLGPAGLRYTESNVLSALKHAHAFLSSSIRPEPSPRALAFVDANVLGAHLVAFGNLYPAYLSQLDDGFTDTQARHWHHLIPALGRVLDNQETFAPEVEVAPLRALLPTNLDRALRRDEYIDLRYSGFLAEASCGLAPQRDLDLLLDYIVVVCQEAHARRHEAGVMGAALSAVGAALPTTTPPLPSRSSWGSRRGTVGSKDPLSLHGVNLVWCGPNM